MLAGVMELPYCEAMTQAHNWSEELAKTIGRQVRLYRDKAGLSAQRLADALAELGAPIERSVLANLESGRRKTVSVPEVIALARVLDVPPLSLIYPVEEDSELVEVVPGVVAEARAAAEWFGGGPFPESPDGASRLDLWLWGDVSVLTQLRQHDRAIRLLLNLVEISRRLVTEVPVDAESREKFQGMTADAERVIRVLRERMRTKGVTPPELPAAFAYLEDETLAAPRTPTGPASWEELMKDLDESDAEAVGDWKAHFSQLLEFVNELRSEIAAVDKTIEHREP